MSNNMQRLQDKMHEVYALEWEREKHPQFPELLSKFVFHMMDATPEITRLASLLQAPETIDIKRFRDMLQLFFVHAVPHLVAAGQLFGHVPEIFPEQRGVHSVLDENGENILRRQNE